MVMPRLRRASLPKGVKTALGWIRTVLTLAGKVLSSFSPITPCSSGTAAAAWSCMSQVSPLHSQALPSLHDEQQAAGSMAVVAAMAEAPPDATPDVPAEPATTFTAASSTRMSKRSKPDCAACSKAGLAAKRLNKSVRACAWAAVPTRKGTTTP